MTKSPGKKNTSLSALIARTTLLTVFFDGTMGSAPSPENGSVRIKVDQVGYLPRASKSAMVNAATATTFEVKRPAEAIVGNPQSWLTWARRSLGTIGVQALTAGEQKTKLEQESDCLAAKRRA
jgi:hypothetical protein